MKWVQRGWIASAIAVILVVGSVLCAAEITVNISIDEVTANGNCSLREAILAANADAVVDMVFNLEKLKSVRDLTKLLAIGGKIRKK